MDLRFLGRTVSNNSALIIVMRSSSSCLLVILNLYIRIQHQYFVTELVLQQEQEEYQREGIQWEHIDYFNNFIICQLVDQSHKGIIAIMDEACLNVGKITDIMLLEEMDRKLKGHKHYSSRRTDSTNKMLSHSEDFQVKHYAGDVIYTISGFIEKNRDTLFQVS